MNPVPTHDYHYGHEADQYTFYRLPKALFTDAKYKNLSDSAKILYGLMLDRMGLSIKNRWMDESNRVFIYFTLEDLQEAMGCGHNKGVKIMSELDNIGLIQRVKQGQGRPTVIYVMRFIAAETYPSRKPESGGNPQGQPQGYQDFPKGEIQASEKRKSRLPDSGSADFPIADTNNTDNNNTDWNDTHISVSPSRPDRYMADTTDRQREAIRRRIDYYNFADDPSVPIEQVDEIVELMLEVQSVIGPTIRVGREEYPAVMVKERFGNITDKHIDFVLNRLRQNTTRVYNIKSYLMKTLFNAPSTIDHHYTQEYNHFYKGGGQKLE